MHRRLRITAKPQMNDNRPPSLARHRLASLCPLPSPLLTVKKT